jgi:hypothetical protein
MKIAIPNKERVSLSESAEAVLSVDEGSQLPMFFVTVRHLTRHYGGPEEGGWWYDRISNEEVHKVFGFDALFACLTRLGDEEYPPSKYGRGSVLGNAGDYEFHVGTAYEEIPDEQLERPSYC